ncbi:hypothetical protein L2E82_49967 [Cichorium intybus]|nr:hypothetical protein L2E82_49967 [Cichorium intybus]
MKPKPGEQTQGFGNLDQSSHPNIVQYYGSELGEETLSVYLEYVSGGSIHGLLQQYGPIARKGSTYDVVVVAAVIAVVAAVGVAVVEAVKAVEEPAEKQEDMKEDTYFHSYSCGNLNDKLMPLHWESYEKVRKKLLSVYATQLLKKEHSGCHALLRDDKHVAAEGTTLIEQAEDVASNKKAENRDVVGLHEQRHSRGWFKTSLEMLENFKSYSAKTSLLDDLSFYGNREKMLKAKRISKAAFQTRNKWIRAEHGVPLVEDFPATCLINLNLARRRGPEEGGALGFDADEFDWFRCQFRSRNMIRRSLLSRRVYAGRASAK